MKTSKIFMGVFCSEGGTPSLECEFCHRTHFASEMDEDDLEQLRSKAREFPDKYIESNCGSIGWGYLDGKQYVWECPCDAGHRYEVFIWRHRELIAEYLVKRSEEELEEAQENEKTSAKAQRAVRVIEHREEKILEGQQALIVAAGGAEEIPF